ncbi:unnamed protein product [marine sediment metagenome]|uniref:Methyltransferase type 11 domain-containing protein n=1 Tax=marine sediment metagenome TaxID=412755 RepID=X1JV67_9ZZZZ
MDKKSYCNPIQIERLTKKYFLPKWVWLEHSARFNFGCKFVKNKIVLDCACGSGIGSVMFAKAGAKKVWAFDIKNGGADWQISPEIKNLVFSVADAQKLPLPNNSVDLIISFETIEHIKNVENYLLESVRVLKSDGIFICSTPNRTITNPGKSIIDKPYNKFHVREYSEEEFINLFKNYFEHIKIYGQNQMSQSKIKIMTKLGKILPLNGAVLINQLLKLPRLIKDNIKNHSVKIKENGQKYEYIIIMAQRKIS